MYREFEPPFELPDIGVEVLECSKNTWLYRRHSDAKTERVVHGRPSFLLNPIEPLQVPKPLARNLMIHLEKPITIAPQSKTLLYLTFPIEVGVFLVRDSNHKRIDEFSLCSPKYTFIGKTNDGILCRFHSSEVFFEIPTLDQSLGLLRLEVVNYVNHWSTINRVLFKAHGMKIYFAKNLASMSASMRIIDRDKAEIECLTSTFIPDSTPAIEVFPIKRLSTHTRKSIMEAF